MEIIFDIILLLVLGPLVILDIAILIKMDWKEFGKAMKDLFTKN